MDKNSLKKKVKRMEVPLLQHPQRHFVRKITAAFFSIIFICFLCGGCQKAKEPEQKKEVQVQKEEVKQPEAVPKEVSKSTEPTKKVEEVKKEQLSPLERAKGREIIQDGQPIITWGSLKELPTLDEVFPVVEKPSERVELPKGVEQVKLPETEERKSLRKNIKHEFYDKLYAVKSPNGKCLIEFYGGTLPNEKREDWLRSIDPETKQILWKYDEPGLFVPDALVHFSQQSDYFILTNLLYTATNKNKVKLFSCKEGYLRDIYTLDTKYIPAYPMGNITPDGKMILIITTDGKVRNFGINGNMLWEKQISPYNGSLLPLHISYDGLYFATAYRSPEIQSQDDRILAGIPQELRLIQLKTGETKMARRYHATLGDKSMFPNTIEIRGIIKDRIVGMWVLDGRGYVLRKTNPYGNTMILFTTGPVFAFRIQSLGFTFTKDGQCISANKKYYDLQPLFNDSGEGKK
ncbi:MAG: hypothetical protein A2Y81_04795 [Nitrospirae bacterium RBG_13_43_8]|nr:MAG: hypothetical protein A2Y81_04795 [Nitrospirae bacterium RBG_13_43_8]